MKKGEKLGLAVIAELIESGLYPAQISEKYKIPKQTLTYSLAKLQKLGCIEKKGYGVWEYKKPLKKSENLTIRHSNTSKEKIRTSPKKEIRGHAFIWKIHSKKELDWKTIVKSYTKKKLCFQLMKHNKVYRTIFNNRKIWLTKKGMVIYESIDFMGQSSFHVKGKAVFEMDALIKSFFKEIKQKFCPYKFTTSREHYAMVKNELARQYNDKKQKMFIRSEEGDVWMWIDYSGGDDELETNEPSTSRQVQNHYNNHKKHKFKVDADFVLKGFDKTLQAINQNTQNLDYHAENMRSHVKAVRQLGDGVENQNQIQLKTLKILEKMEKKLK